MHLQEAPYSHSFPKNVELTYGVMSGDKDQSDISKDRIYGTQTVTDGKTIKTLMYYKVD